MLRDVLEQELSEVTIEAADLEKFEEELASAGAGVSGNNSGTCEGKCTTGNS